MLWKPRLLLLGALSGAAFVLALLLYFSPPPHEENEIIIGDNRVRVLVADTESERARGLSGRETLALDEGMLFVFEEPGTYGFWMKEMRFSIDILWISAEGRVVGVEKSASPDSYPRIFTPPIPIRYVLEAPAGFFDAHQLEVGQKVLLP